jgi:hypothetical protein
MRLAANQLTQLLNKEPMKTNNNYPLIIAASFLLLTSGLSAQTSEQGQMFGKAWLSMNCIEADGGQDEMDTFVKYKDELEPYFTYVIRRGLELEGMQDEETALGEIYDRNIKMLNENKPAWVTPEYESKIGSVSREVFIQDGKEALAQNYKDQALKGLELIKSLRSR